MKNFSTLQRVFSLNQKLSAIALSTFAALILFAQTANAATAYYVTAQDVYVRAKPQSYAMGRLYNHTNTGQGRMDIQYVDSNGWAYGYAYGYVNRCIWAQYSYQNSSGGYSTNFRTNGTTVSDKCRNTNRYLEISEFSNGEIFMNESNTDGQIHTLSAASNTWDNWSWGSGTGNNNYRGVTPAGSKWKIRYTTNDGAGVMARPCSYDAGGNLSCASDWYFIQRSTL